MSAVPTELLDGGSSTAPDSASTPASLSAQGPSSSLGSSSATEISRSRSAKGRVLHSSVHQEFIQVSSRDPSKKRQLSWTSECKVCHKIIQDKLPKTLLTHLKQHPDVLSKVTFLDEKNKIKHDEREKLKPTSKEDVLKNKFLRMLLSTGSRWDIAENKEFRELVLEINPAVQLPGEESIKKFAETTFQEMKEDMMNILTEANRVSVTCDLWSNFNVQESFIGLTVHGFNKLLKDRFSFRLALR